MTTTTETPACPKCSGPMWDQKAGKYPYKEGTPIFKCKDKECGSNGGVIWEPKGGAKPAPKPNAPKPHSFGAPGFLEGAEEQDAADLAARVFVGKETGAKYVAWSDRQINDLALYESLTDWYLATIAPKYLKAEIGCSPESTTAGIAALFIQAKK